MASKGCEHATPTRTGCHTGSDAGLDRSHTFAHCREFVGKSTFWFRRSSGGFHFSLGTVHWTDLLSYRRARRLSSHDAKGVGAHPALVLLPCALAGFCLPSRGSHCLPWQSARAS